MSAGVTNYQCPACTGPLQFSSEMGKLVCEYCGNDYEPDYIEDIYSNEEAKDSGEMPSWATGEAGMAWSETETASLRAYSCPSCGAEIICDHTTAATSCVYCGNPTIVPGQLGGALKPDYVIPFQLDKEAAKEKLRAYYKNKRLLPKSFSGGNHIEEIKGIYAPFWLFDGKADAHVRFSAKRVHKRTSGNYEITTIENYRIVREGNVTFYKVPVDGSTKMPDAHMDAIEPYDYKDLREFSTAYLPGFLADKYDLDAAECAPRANSRIRGSVEMALKSTVTGYSLVTPELTNIRLRQGEVKYALLPVWMLHTKWNGKSFLFAMNGQTGKLIGDLPIDKGRYLAWLVGISLPLALILLLIFFVL